MKVLVVQLLRMGDVVLSTPVIKGLRKKYPDSEVQVLVNEECNKIVRYLPGVSKVHYFDRKEIQHSIGHADRSLFEPFARLDQLFHKMNNEQFDLVVNLTHTKLSGYICSQISAEEKIGLSLDDKNMDFGGSWFQFLNEHGTGDRDGCFHLSDIFYYGSKLPGKSESMEVVRDFQCDEKVSSVFAGIDDLVVIQPRTSDRKKEYGEANWVQFAKKCYALNPQSRLVFVGAPSEEDSINKIVQELVGEGYSVFKFICSIGELISLIQISQAVVSGDTLTLHLAAAMNARIIEVSLGSSDHRLSGPFNSHSLIVSSNELCAPCGHSENCFRTFHACAEMIPPSVLAMLTHYRIVEDWESIYQVAAENSEVCSVYVTLRDSLPTWSCVKLNETFSEKNISHWVSQVAWYLFLQCRDNGGLFEMGKETYNLHQFLDKNYPGMEPSDWRYMYEQLKRVYEDLESQVNSILFEVRGLASQYENSEVLFKVQRSLTEMRRKFSGFFFLETYLEALDYIVEDSISQPFLVFRRMLLVLSELRDRLIIEIKVTDSLISRMEDVYGREI